jgi:hypothetical protein
MLTPAEVSLLTGKSLKTLIDDRRAGRGIPCVKDETPRYLRGDVDAWVAAHRRATMDVP